MPISGQKTVTTAGAAVPLGADPICAPLMVKALPGNTGSVAIGNDGSNDVTTANGLLLAAGESVVFSYVSTLAQLYVDAAVNGEGVCWVILSI
ncbi:MAG: hypothetical protein IT316_14325 [Anaerolineales bacterium]|nr:hypothetical protein [Anaerolineales bacterium]